MSGFSDSFLISWIVEMSTFLGCLRACDLSANPANCSSANRLRMAWAVVRLPRVAQRAKLKQRNVHQTIIDLASKRRSRRAPMIERHQCKKSGRVRRHRGKKHHLWRSVGELGGGKEIKSKRAGKRCWQTMKRDDKLRSVRQTGIARQALGPGETPMRALSSSQYLLSGTRAS